MQKGLHHIFEEAGFEWREPGCSMCLGMNPDQVPGESIALPLQIVILKGRQGKGARTHLVSPAMAWQQLRYMVILLILERRVMMEPFRIHKGTAAVLMNDNIDTDQIIPKQYLKRIERTGFGKYLFDEWRYDNERYENPNFPLNAPDEKEQVY